MVNAFATANRLVLGQLATEAKSNEITAIPKLLELLDLHGATVTIDAMGCQKELARQIISQGGDYVLAVKDNQPNLHAHVKALLDEAILDAFKGMEGDYSEETNGGHGRIEVRKVWCTPEVQWLKGREDWPGIRSLAVVESGRQVLGSTNVERSYYRPVQCVPVEIAQIGDVDRVLLLVVSDHGVPWKTGVESGIDLYLGRCQRIHIPGRDDEIARSASDVVDGREHGGMPRLATAVRRDREANRIRLRDT